MDGALASNCKPDRPVTVPLSEESVKGAVSSHNLEFRATEIKENSVKMKQLLRYLLNWTKKNHWTREALTKIFAQRGTEKNILQAQNELTLKWLETCPVRFKNKLKQAHRYAKSDSQLRPKQDHRYAKPGSRLCQIRLKNKPNQAVQMCQTGHTNITNLAQIGRPLRDPLKGKSSYPFHSSLVQRYRTHLQRGEAN